MSANDIYDGRRVELGDPGDAFPVTPHDTNFLPYATRGLYVGGAGNVAGYTVSGTAVTFVEVQAGTVLPVRLARILVAGTTATSMVGLY